MTFDLEKAREVAAFMQAHHHYGYESFAAALDEIERLLCDSIREPDASWQITEERKAAIDLAYIMTRECDDHVVKATGQDSENTKYVAVLRAMLEEAGQ